MLEGICNKALVEQNMSDTAKSKRTALQGVRASIHRMDQQGEQMIKRKQKMIEDILGVIAMMAFLGWIGVLVVQRLLEMYP